jgi:parallel beta-helix repeat protein
MSYVTSRIGLPKLFLLFFILPLLSYLGGVLFLSPHITQAAGNTYYVAAAGNDSNSCSQSAPCRTIGRGVSAMSGGDTLVIHAGTYPECIGDICDGGPTVPDGFDGTPTTIMAAPGETVIMNPSGTARVFATLGGQWITIDGIHMDGSGVKYDVIKLESYQSQIVRHVTLRNLEIHHNGNGTGILTSCDTCLYQSLDIHRNFGYGIYGSNNSIIENSSIHDNGGYGLHLYDGSGAYMIKNNIVRNNRLYGNGFGTKDPNGNPAQYPAMIISTGSNNLVYNNLVYNNWGGIDVKFDCIDCVVENNTIYGNQNVGIYLGDPWGGITNPVVRNNIVYNNGGSAIVQDQIKGTLVMSNNLIDTNPNFVNPGSGDFHLQSSSPAKDAGTTLPEVPCDFDGNGRPAGSAYDIGAYEYGGTPNANCSKGGGGIPTPTPAPSGAPCTQYTNTSQIPQGFGVPWDVTNPSIMLVSAQCTPPTLLLKAGNPNTTGTLYVYKDGYVAVSGASSWTPVQLFGSSLISGAWYPKSAQGVTQIQGQTMPTTYYVAYTCMWTGTKWMCGCRDQACGQSYWQLQRIQ